MDLERRHGLPWHDFQRFYIKISRNDYAFHKAQLDEGAVDKSVGDSKICDAGK
jgi:hypothetical protein